MARTHCGKALHWHSPALAFRTWSSSSSCCTRSNFIFLDCNVLGLGTVIVTHQNRCLGFQVRVEYLLGPSSSRLPSFGNKHIVKHEEGEIMTLELDRLAGLEIRAHMPKRQEINIQIHVPKISYQKGNKTIFLRQRSECLLNKGLVMTSETSDRRQQM